jgi:anti-sigma B factor antagonist
MQLSVNAREAQGISVLELSGRLIAGEECESLRNQIRELLASNHKRILLILTDLTRVDSSGIGTLVESVIVTVKDGGQFKLANVPRLAHNILVTHRLLQAFEIYSSEEEALASFTEQSRQPTGQQ